MCRRELYLPRELSNEDQLLIAMDAQLDSARVVQLMNRRRERLEHLNGPEWFQHRFRSMVVFMAQNDRTIAMRRAVLGVEWMERELDPETLYFEGFDDVLEGELHALDRPGQ